MPGPFFVLECARLPQGEPNMAIDLFSEFGTDTKAEEDGVWEEYADGVAFLIARSNNKKYARLITKAFEKNKRLLEAKNDAAEAKSEEIIVDVSARALLLGWRGDLQWKGEPMEYSLENAKTLLAVKDFRRWVFERAEDIDRYKTVKKDADSEK